MALELSARYRNILNEGSFQSLLSPSPWPHFILDNLLDSECFSSVQSRLLKNHHDFYIAEDHEAKLQLSYLNDLELAQFFFSGEVRSLFEGIAGCQLEPNKDLAIQCRRMTPDSPEFPPHVDLIGEPSLVALYYVSPGWTDEKGGEVLLLKDQDATQTDPSTKWIAPVENRLFLFLSSDQYWHCVRKVKDWTRLLVLTEWLQKREAIR